MKSGNDGTHNTDDLSSALESMDEIADLIKNRRIALFLDYDGTLTPIVDRPENAHLSDGMKQVLRGLARDCIVAVISGRDLRDVRGRVGLPELIYAGSHGFEIQGPEGMRLQKEHGRDFLPVLDQAEAMLMERIELVPGARVERKKFSISVHYRQVPDSNIRDVREAVHFTVRNLAKLRITEGKKVFELQPAIEWDKGGAVLWLLEALDLGSEDVLPLYLGDDTTDEDGFRAIRGRGIGIVVAEHPRETLAHYTLRGTGEVREFLESLARKTRGV